MANEEKDNNEEKDSVPQPEQVPTAESGPVEATVARMEMVADQTAAEEEEDPALVRAAYEHPLPIRITHWVNAISLFVMVTSGLRIFRAFPSFGPKIPEKVLLTIPRYITLGGWLGGALQWHFTFMWFFVASGVLYVAYQVFSGHYRTMLFLPRDVAGVWPMARHYFFFGPKPAAAANTTRCKSWPTPPPLGSACCRCSRALSCSSPHSFLGWRFYSEGFTSPASGTSPRCADSSPSSPVT